MFFKEDKHMQEQILSRQQREIIQLILAGYSLKKNS